jgi:serine/threonine protein kinase/Tfp pilus assembly protein PilF
MDLEHVSDDDLVRRLPLPLAHLYRRACNAKSPFDRHQAAYFLWEAALRLLASTAVVSFAENPQPHPDLLDELKKLARPSLGDWWAFVRRFVPILADAGDPGFTAVRALLLDRARNDLPRAAELDAVLREILSVPQGPQGMVRVSELFDRLVRYRNKEIGHGAAGLRHGEFYERVGRALLPAVAELLGRLDVLAGRRLVYVEEVPFQKSGVHLVKRLALTGESPRRIESLEWPASESVWLPRPEQVYLDGSARDAASTIAMASLRPLLVYDPKLEEVLFLNARRSRLRCEYLCFTTGEQQERDELEGEQRALLARLLGIGGSIDAAEFARWAEASRSGGTPDEPAPAGAGAALVARPARRVGEFELLSELGRGNMGTVYRAWQPSLGRQVALKVVARTDEKAIARFRREVRALGKVDHPNLVKIFTSGFDAEPCYYTMELVEGASLANVCATLNDRGTGADAVDLATWHEAVSSASAEARKAEKSLSDPGAEGTDMVSVPHAGVRQSAAVPVQPPSGRDYVRQVVELVRQVALAAQALHISGVVHRDIKPGNIMLTADGAQAVLMDLGLAQLADDVEGRLTRTRQFIGTLRYASPEQVLSAGALDHRSDIYSLGATLWELLTLRPIHDATDATPDPVLMRRITSDDPERIHKYHHGIARDLEAIVQKCLEKDPARRYATAAELADDLGRWLRGELVLAQPLTFRYWTGKLARRYRWPIAAAGALMILVASGALYEINRIHRANERLRGVNQQLTTANRELAGALKQVEEQRGAAERAGWEADKNRIEAQAARAKAEAINRFLLNDMLAQAAPEKNARERKVTVEEVLDRAVQKIDRAFVDQLEVQAAILNTIGRTFDSLGAYAKAEPLHRRALQSRSKTLGPEHPDTLTSMSELASVLWSLGKLDEAAALNRQALEARRRILGPEHPDTLISMNNLGTVLRAQGKLDEVAALIRQALEARRRTRGPEHPQTLTSMNNLADVCRGQGKFDEAAALNRQVLEARRRTLGPQHPETLTSMNNLAAVLQDQGKHDEATALCRQVIEARRRALGPEHPHTLQSMGTLAVFLMDEGKPGEAEPLLRDLLLAQRKTVPVDEVSLANTLSPLGWALTDMGQAVAAEPLLREALAIRTKRLPPGLWVTASTASLLGACLFRQDRYAEAEPLLRESVAVLQTARGVPPLRVRQALVRLIALYDAWGKPDRAEAYRLKLLDFDFPADPFAP